MFEAIIALLLAPIVIAADGLILGTIFSACFVAGRRLEHKLYALGLWRTPPDGRSGIIIFMSIVMGIPSLIVVCGRLSGRLPP